MAKILNRRGTWQHGPHSTDTVYTTMQAVTDASYLQYSSILLTGQVQQTPEAFQPQAVTDASYLDLDLYRAQKNQLAPH